MASVGGVEEGAVGSGQPEEAAVRGGPDLVALKIFWKPRGGRGGNGRS